MELGTRQYLVLNINAKPEAGRKEQVRLVTEGGQRWLQGIVTMYKPSLPLSTLQAVGHSGLLSFKSSLSQDAPTISDLPMDATLSDIAVGQFWSSFILL